MITTVSGGYGCVMSPLIESIEWGKIKVHNHEKCFKDCILYGYTAEEWDWSIYGTNHKDGISVEEIKQFTYYVGKISSMSTRPTAFVLSSGMHMKINTNKHTLSFLKQLESEHGMKYFIGETTEAVKKYNEWRETERIVGFFHSTC